MVSPILLPVNDPLSADIMFIHMGLDNSQDICKVTRHSTYRAISLKTDVSSGIKLREDIKRLFMGRFTWFYTPEFLDEMSLEMLDGSRIMPEDFSGHILAEVNAPETKSPRCVILTIGGFDILASETIPAYEKSVMLESLCQAVNEMLGYARFLKIVFVGPCQPLAVNQMDAFYRKAVSYLYPTSKARRDNLRVFPTHLFLRTIRDKFGWRVLTHDDRLTVPHRVMLQQSLQTAVLKWHVNTAQPMAVVNYPIKTFSSAELPTPTRYLGR